ncbi:glycoside hydrolase family 13/glycosyltransferase family 5 protein [Fistulina hepatica ATCC 64428]|uniref:alpha-1,3-glucan synthase n=1 Tax=Fistulina hepatica ATCC 64428 TaxID=1128425 RepID=A0A0D7ANY9_9AGAR|nr:glycoside hydrolase family 13/glycosyltransferase family 5 protein [Fistulina hepatica ATCC 64428]
MVPASQPQAKGRPQTAKSPPQLPRRSQSRSRSLFSCLRSLPTSLLLLATAFSVAYAAPYNEEYADYNVNQNTNASANPLNYTTTRANTTYTPSPDNWRAIPFYTVLMDKFADGDPVNNDYFGTFWEWDWRETQLRYGGDPTGLAMHLDYLYGMGARAIFASGTPFLNMMWEADSYSPLDFTVVDPHWGTLNDYVEAINAVHAHGMYYMMDFTVGTMANLLAFVGYLNTSAPFTIDTYSVEWALPVLTPWNFSRYKDFTFDNERTSNCTPPTFYGDEGNITVVADIKCRNSEFDQYGDMESFGNHPDWQRQLSNFAGVQDRLRDWDDTVMAKLQHFACLAIKAFDIDAIRIDKATQLPVSSLATWATSVRQCAADVNKTNFFITGEVTGSDTSGSLYYGRGRQPSMYPSGFLESANTTAQEYFIREKGNNGLDAVAYHYSVSRALNRFMGLDGTLTVSYDVSTDFVTMWNEMFVHNDFRNPNTDEIDPRHLYGSSNFDIFRWPSVADGTQLSALGTFVGSLLMPGIPLLFYGEEQGFYLYDNTASNYLYGRQAMFSNSAWKRHGCYSLGSDDYYNFAIARAAFGCHDDWNTLDHFDPTAEMRRLVASFWWLRTKYAVLQDGWLLEQASYLTHLDYKPYSSGVPTQMGLWSLVRGEVSSLQNLTASTNGSTTSVWFLISNENYTRTWTYECGGDNQTLAPFDGGKTVRNLLAPFETITLSSSDNDTYPGCVETITMDPYTFKAFVLSEDWLALPPMLSYFYPGHDARIDTTETNTTSVGIVLGFSQDMDCDSVTNSLSFNMSSSGSSSSSPSVDTSSVSCLTLSSTNATTVSGVSNTTWTWTGTIDDVADGILRIYIDRPSSQGGVSTDAKDTLVLRKGSSNNVMVFPENDYSSGNFKYENGEYTYTHTAYGADKFRYSWNFARNWTNWTDWEDTTTLNKTLLDDKTEFDGKHIIMQYWSEAMTSAAVVTHADVDFDIERRYPKLLVRGDFNNWGFEKMKKSAMTLESNGTWYMDIASAWPEDVQLTLWTASDIYFYGDVDGDGILDRLPPSTSAPSYVNMSAPPLPHLAWRLYIDDSINRWTLEPRGQIWVSIVMYGLLLGIPFFTAAAAVMIFIWSFYGIKYNQYGAKPNKGSYVPILGGKSKAALAPEEKASAAISKYKGDIIGWPENQQKQRKMLIATLEYEVLDWKVKVKIGGLGVMASLMGKAMTDVDIVWVCPKVKDVEYPAGDPAEPYEVIIFGEPYLIEVETHVLDNITYVLLDSPVFRAQTKSDPYPARMDDLSSAIFYSTWNQAIAQTIRRYPDIDIYHINDYHGALATLYLLPKIFPVCLSLHNAEFQGLWPLRTKAEMKEVCSAFNLPKEVCEKYVQFGNTFNLLHAAASIIAVHQRSVGVAGVSDKYGKRSWARYPALWNLKHVDSLPNPDPADVEALDEHPISVRDIRVDDQAEAARPENKRQAQEWAGIKQDPNSDLFVFVGRWSKQKGVDLIADVMPGLMEKKPSIQLICVGPVIDLYGRFAAAKLARLMEQYPDRVYSKPEFTALPPYLFSGADFALIPSRDEPFGLVAVEFGRKGALGVGSRLGGLGLMPGWWFPVESSSTEHMLSQLTKTIRMALKSTEKERALLRARSAVQRFPVVEWRQRTEDFHRRAIIKSRSVAGHLAWRHSDGNDSAAMVPIDHDEDWDPRYQPEPSQPAWDSRSMRSSYAQDQDYHDPGSNEEQGHVMPPRLIRSNSSSDEGVQDPYQRGGLFYSNSGQTDYSNFLDRANRIIAKDHRNAPDPFLEAPHKQRPFSTATGSSKMSRVSSVESIASIIDEKSNSPLNQAVASFTDADGGVTQEFITKLQELSSSNSRGDLCIEKYLQKSEEAFFDKVKKDKISSAVSTRSSNRDSVWGTPEFDYSRPSSPMGSTFGSTTGGLGGEPPVKIMTRTQVFLAREIFGWPLYTIIMSLGQMLGATTFQITLLSGRDYEDDWEVYMIGGVFLAASLLWYVAFRLKPSYYVLSAPWFCYGLAFFLVGLPSVASALNVTHSWLSHIATWFYATASAAGFLFFSLNFGEEAGASTEVWMLRAVMVQGTSQLWTAALWYWGSKMSGSDDNVLDWWIVCIVWPLGAISFVFGFLLIKGLPDYYRETPPKVDGLYKTLLRRNIIIWFIISEILRDFWLSNLNGLNWGFLWDTNVKTWKVIVLILVFFVIVWGVLMWVLTWFSVTHTWLLPIFAVGLGAPRWCQMLWGTTGLGNYVPWAGSDGPLLGISLWLWLGVLDSIQGVGLGLILLQTLSRLHVSTTLAFTQMIGSVVVMIAHLIAPNPMPDIAAWNPSQGLLDSPFVMWAFWVCLACQLLIVLGYFWFFRKEQLCTLFFPLLLLDFHHLISRSLSTPVRRGTNYHVTQNPRKRTFVEFMCFACLFAWESTNFAAN